MRGVQRPLFLRNPFSSSETCIIGALQSACLAIIVTMANKLEQMLVSKLWKMNCRMRKGLDIFFFFFPFFSYAG